MTGWRLGFGAGPVELIRAMTVVQSQCSTHTSSVSQAAVRGSTQLPVRTSSYRATGRSGNEGIWWLACSTGPRASPAGHRRERSTSTPPVVELIGRTAPDGTAISGRRRALRVPAGERGCRGGARRAAFGMSPYFRISYAASTDALTEACRRIQRACASLR